MLESVKTALRITTDAFDTELAELIAAALADMGITDIKTALLVTTDPDPLILQAVKTYCRIHFGEPDNVERLERSYNEQKAQLTMASNYTDWSE